MLSSTLVFDRSLIKSRALLSSRLGKELGSREKYWRRRAYEDFDVSEEFFDLDSESAPEQRYLLLASYYRLCPSMAAKVYQDGELEGLYEARAGMREAKQRNDKEMLTFFSLRAKEKVVEDERACILYLERGEGISSLSNDDILFCLRRGKRELLSLLCEEEVCYEELRWGIKQDLQELNKEKALKAAAYSCLPELFLWIAKELNIEKFPSFLVPEICQGYLCHRRAEGAYALLSLCENDEEAYSHVSSTGNYDLILLQLERDNYEHALFHLQNNKGYLPLFIILSPLLSSQEDLELEQSLTSYPLCREILHAKV